MELPFLNNTPESGDNAEGGDFWNFGPQSNAYSDDVTLNELLALYQSANEVAPPFAPISEPEAYPAPPAPNPWGAEPAAPFDAAPAAPWEDAGAVPYVPAEPVQSIPWGQDAPVAPEPVFAMPEPIDSAASEPAFAMPEPVIPTAPEPVFTMPEPVVPAASEPVFTMPEPVVPAAPDPVFTMPEPVVPAAPEPVFTMPEPVIPAAPEPVFTMPEPVVAADPEPVFTMPEPVVPAVPEPVFTMPEPVAPAAEPLFTMPEPAVAVASEPVFTMPEPVATVPDVPAMATAAATSLERTVPAVTSLATSAKRQEATTQISQIATDLAQGVDAIQSRLETSYERLSTAAARRAPVLEIIEITNALGELKGQLGENSPLYQQALALRQLADSYMDLLKNL